MKFSIEWTLLRFVLRSFGQKMHRVDRLKHRIHQSMHRIGKIEPINTNFLRNVLLMKHTKRFIIGKIEPKAKNAQTHAHTHTPIINLNLI